MDYYTAPPDPIFEDIKVKATGIWSTYDDTYGYATEKISRIKPLKNIRDNALYMVAMFDGSNKQQLLDSLEEDSKVWLRPYLEEEQRQLVEAFMSTLPKI